MLRRFVVLPAVIAFLAAAPSSVSARPHGPTNYFSSATSYRVASLHYTSSAVRRDHDQDTGKLLFMDSQSSNVRLHSPTGATLSPIQVVTYISGGTSGQMTRYASDNSGGSWSCSYRLSLIKGDELIVNFKRTGSRVAVTFIISSSNESTCTATGGDAEFFNYHLPDKTYPVSMFRGNTIVLHNSGSYVDYPNGPSNNSWNWNFTLTLRKR